MVITQLLLNESGWNNVHFVANLVGFKININLNQAILNFFLGNENPIENPIVCFFSDTVCSVRIKGKCKISSTDHGYYLFVALKKVLYF